MSVISIFFFKQKTAYELRISDWSSDVCSSDLIYIPAAGQAHRDGDIHIHDLDMLSGYCAGWSLRQLLTEGFNGIPGKVEATPARHLSAAIGQIVNFLGTLQHAWAGAQASSRPEKRRAGKELWREGRFRVS